MGKRWWSVAAAWWQLFIGRRRGPSGAYAADLGRHGEVLAERYLRRQGIRVVARQVRIAGGEIDLIGVERRVIVFVEVKSRSSDHAGQPFEAVTDKKQDQLVHCALAYLQRHDLLECAFRFDVVSIVVDPERGSPEIRHFREAFTPRDRYQFFT